MSASLTATPGGTPPPGVASASGSPPPGAGPAGGAQPPIGGSSATGPSQNLGATAQGNQIAAALVQMMTMAMTKVPPGTPLYKAISKAHFEIGKELEPGSSSPAGIDNAMKAAMMQRARMAPQVGAQATQAGTPQPAAAGVPKPPTPVAA